MCGKAAKIQLTDRMYAILSEIASSRTMNNSIVQRAKIVLLGLEKLENRSIALQLGLCPKTVGRWRQRWRASWEALLLMQFEETTAGLRRAIIHCLADAPRRGSPGTFTAEQVAGLIAVACERPQDSERPVSSWTGRELADECRQRNLAEISPSHVNRILREVNLRPHKRKYWCNTTEKDKEVFQQQVEVVCQAYLEADERYEQRGTHTVCVDEMTGLQANERRAATKPPRPGQVAKEEFQYTRHGALCFTGNWDVVLGQMTETTISKTRNNEDFAEHIRRTIAADLAAEWVFVVDNLNTHCGEPLVRMVAQLLGMDQAALGTVKKEGILKSMNSRRAFLSDPNHRIRFVYLPKHSSWLNQIEIVFGIIQRRVLRGGSFKSQDHLREELLRFIDYYNRTFAKPMHWTYTGRPTRNQPTPRPKTWREAWQRKPTRQELALVGLKL